MELTSFGIIVVCTVTLFSIILHEVAHGYVAYFFKDKTAFLAGRLTLNPLPHIDILGSVIVPLASIFLSGSLFGWAKPVPVNPRNLVGKYAEFWVAAAGVLTNLFLVIVSLILAHIFSRYNLLGPAVEKLLLASVSINLSLFLFNLIPVPPFDGMAILQGLFPRLRINSRIIYNPIYMIVAIVVASYLYSAIAPTVFSFVLRGL